MRTGRARAHHCTGRTGAAVGGHEGQQVVHGGEFRAVNQVAAITLLGNQPGVGQFFQVKRQGRAGYAQRFGQAAGRHALNTGHHQLAKNLQTRLLGQCRQCAHRVGFGHGVILSSGWVVGRASVTSQQATSMHAEPTSAYNKPPHWYSRPEKSVPINRPTALAA